MLRTTVYLDEETSLALRQLAAIYGRSQAELIREAIDQYIARIDKQTQRQLPGAGRYRSGRQDVSESAKTLLRKRVRSRR